MLRPAIAALVTTALVTTGFATTGFATAAPITAALTTTALTTTGTLVGAWLRAAAVAIAPPGAHVEVGVRLVVRPVRHALVVAAGPRQVTLLIKATTLIKAAPRACSGRSARAAALPLRRAATPAGPPWRTLPALVAVVLAATGQAPAARPVGELLGILRSHASCGNNDDDENYNDNYCQDDHELSHRTIQHGVASQGGASEARAAIDADLSRCASTLNLIRG
jgi:hypothetical protein